MYKDPSAILPEGNEFLFWEKECVVKRILHVNAGSPAADDANDGSEERPFKTIGQAALIAQPGDKVLIHAGIYRECVHPARGGTDPENMICYEAAGDGEAVISASEVVTDFSHSTGWQLERPSTEPTDYSHVRIYQHKLDPDMFRGYNPFCCVNILHDRLFIEYDKTDMTTYLNRRGCVFCDGEPLVQMPLYNKMAQTDNSFWVEANGQTIHFRLKGDADPAEHKIEITVREQCFAPEKPFLNYIKVKGLVCKHAATGAPVPQRGAISCYRGSYWVIEDCTVDWSNALAMDVGDECWHHYHLEPVDVGHTVIRNCRIKDAGVCGIAGLYATHMLIEGNTIEGTGWQKMELSWEAGGIKLHDTVNTLIRNNVIRNTFRADHLWLDCNNENNRITGNLFLNGIEQREAIFIECTREGVNLIDNNIIWNVEGRFDPSKIPAEPGSSGWYKLKEDEAVNGYGIYGEGTDRLYIAHNLIGKCRHSGYYAKPVGFRMGNFMRGGTSRKAKIINNIFYDCGEAAIVFPTQDNEAEGNLYVKMRGGYLRVMYPAPETCLNLSAWQEFYGFDKTGQCGWFDMDVTGENGGITLRVSERIADELFFKAEKLGIMLYPDDMQRVKRDEHVPYDRMGRERGEMVLPGPYELEAR